MSSGSSSHVVACFSVDFTKYLMFWKSMPVRSEPQVGIGFLQIGRAHVCTPVTNAHLVCRPLLEKTKKDASISTLHRSNKPILNSRYTCVRVTSYSDRTN